MTLRPTPDDGFPTATSNLQASTEDVLRAFIPQGATQPMLTKNAHLQFLVRNLFQGFPSRYVSQDASQPWLMFWSLHSFSILQVSMDPANKQRCVPPPPRTG